MRLVFLSSVLLLLLVACQSYRSGVPKDPPDEFLENAQIQFIFEDIHPSFFSKETKGTMFLNVFIYYKGPRLQSKDVKEIRLLDDEGMLWTTSPEVNRTYIGGWLRFNTGNYSINESVLRIRQYTVQIVMHDGHVHKLEFDPTDPESGRGNIRGYVYSTDYQGYKGDSHVQCLHRAQIKQFEIQDHQVHLSFAVNDRRVESGQIAFYDKAKRYIGETAVFMNTYSLEYRRWLNKGAALFADGADNQVEIPLSDLSIEEGRSASEIEYANVVLSDSADWMEAPTRSETVFESRSEMVLLQRKNWNITNRWSSRLRGRSELAVLSRREP
jgi:hypothetical protein